MQGPNADRIALYRDVRPAHRGSPQKGATRRITLANLSRPSH